MAQIIRQRGPCRGPNKHVITFQVIIFLLWGQIASARTYFPWDATPKHSDSTAQSQQDIRALEPGASIVREMERGDVHSYQVTLTAGQYMSVVVVQRGVDAAVRLGGPDGQHLYQFDSRWHGPEPVSFIAEVSGYYRLEIRALQKTGSRGGYEITFEELRAPEPKDQKRFSAGRASTEAKILIAQGTAQSFLKAREKYEESLPLWQAVDDRFGEAQTLNSLGFLCNAFGEQQKALDYYNRALPLRRAIRDLIGEGETLHNIASVYSALGEKQKALDYYHQALPPRRAAGDRFGEAFTLSNMAGIYYSLGEQQKALDSYNQALLLHHAGGSPRGEASTLIGIGGIYLLGDIQKALDSFNQALSLSRAIDDYRGEAYALLNIGSVYKELDENQKALDYYNQALPLFRAVADRRGEASALHSLGVVSSSMDEQQRALDNYSQALALWRTVKDRYSEVNTINSIGQVYDKLGEKQKALDSYSQALPLFRAVGNRRGEAAVLNNLGVLYVSLGEQQKAFDSYNQALPLWRTLGDLSSEAGTLLNLAHLDRGRDNLTDARSHMEASLAIFESLRTKLANQSLRASYFASVQESYDFYVDLLMQMSQRDPARGFDAIALQVSERARARSLLDLLTESRADIRQGIEPALLKRERSLQQQINAKAEYQSRLLGGRHTKEQAEAARKELDGLIEESQKTEAQIRQASPQYADLKYPRPLTLPEVQQLLDADTLLLEYSLGSERSHLWAVTPASIASFELPKRAEIEAAARRVYGLLTARNQRVEGETQAQRRARVAQAEARYPEAAAALSRMLLGPVAAQLGRKRLLIVADGALQYLPFAALPAPGSAAPTLQGRASTPPDVAAATRPGVAYTPLVVEHEIVSLPSASTLAIIRRNIAGRLAAPKVAAILADPVFEPTDLRVKRGASAGQTPTGDQPAATRDVLLDRALNDSGVVKTGQPIPRLPYSQREAAAIKALVPDHLRKLALGFEANYATATSAELGNYRFVHFATHALLDSDRPELSGILLSLVDKQGKPQERGLLRLNEIYNLKLPAELVVLSACQTALGKEVKGEGLVGLTRGFMYAGAPRVLASLWKVDDAATAELMKRFYEGMLGARRLRPADALRQAQLEMWRKPGYQAPYYWGAFTLQGEWK